MNRVAKALAHFLVAVQTRQPGERRQEWLWLDQDLLVRAKHIVETTNDFPCELEMGHLVVADRDELRIVHGHVGRLQQGIPEESNRRKILVPERLLLLPVCRHALEPGHRHHHRKEQIQLGVLRYLRLNEKGALLRIEAGANPVGHVLVRVGGQLTRVGVVAGQGVPVGDEVEAVVLVLQRHPVAERPDQVPQMEAPGGTHP